MPRLSPKIDTASLRDLIAVGAPVLRLLASSAIMACVT